MNAVRPVVRARRRTVLGAAALGVATLALTSTVWMRTTAWSLDERVAVTLTGTNLAPAATAGGLVVLAASLALALGRWWGRRVAGLGVVLGGAVVVAAVVAAVADPRPAAAAQAQATVGVGDLAGRVWLTPVPWVALACGVGAVVLGVYATLARWVPAPGARYERVAAPDEPDEHASWDALSRGEDPTT